MQAASEVLSGNPAPAGELSPTDVFQRLGSLTRSLHDALRQLGYDRAVENAVGALPDARDRLQYIASLTGRAAERVLGAAERAKATQERVREHTRALQARWDGVLAGDASAQALAAAGGETRAFLQALPALSDAVDQELTDIMLAQDFHDLTGQVIQRVTRLAQTLEEQLVKLLLDATPPEQRREVLENGLAGPVIHAQGRDDVVTNQSQVDDLLESLGF